MIALNDTVISTMRERRSAGERVSVLAAELGIPWQKLDKAIRHGPSGGGVTRADDAAQIVTPSPVAGPLTERYRPRNLADLFGQDKVVRFLQTLAAKPYPVALLFEGETGTGKTSAALALAAELGCDTAKAEMGGVWVIASGEQSADAVRNVCESMWRTPFYGSGWKTLIVNEADRMSAAAETIWLDRLENVPPKTVIVFTTNHAGRLSQRFRDRCVRLAFESDAGRLRAAARRMLAGMWKAETHKAPPAELVEQIVADAAEGGKLSFRRAVQLLQCRLMEPAGDAGDGGVQ